MSFEIAFLISLYSLSREYRLSKNKTAKSGKSIPYGVSGIT